MSDDVDMTHMTFGLDPVPKEIRKLVFLDEMNLMVPCKDLVPLNQPQACGAKVALGGWPSFPFVTMLRFLCLRLWWNLSDPAMEEELHEQPLYDRSAGLECAAQMRDPETHQTKNGHQWHFGKQTHIGVEAEVGLVRTVICTTANINDMTQATQLLQHGQEKDVFARARCKGVDKRDEIQGLVLDWHIAMRLVKCAALDLSSKLAEKTERVGKIKDRFRAKVEHQFRLVKQQLSNATVRYCGLLKKKARLQAMFAVGQSTDGAQDAVAGRADMSAPAVRRYGLNLPAKAVKSGASAVSRNQGHRSADHASSGSDLTELHQQHAKLHNPCRTLKKICRLALNGRNPSASLEDKNAKHLASSVDYSIKSLFKAGRMRTSNLAGLHIDNASSVRNGGNPQHKGLTIRISILFERTAIYLRAFRKGVVIP